MRKSILIGILVFNILNILTISSVGAMILMPTLIDPPTIPKDSDGDGLTDYEEIYIYNTNPYNSDTDGDGLTDWEDVTYSFNPTVAEATHMFVYNNKVYCGVAYLAWVSDYSNWFNYFYFNSLVDLITLFVMDVQLNGDLTLDPLDGSLSPSFNYVSALEQKGYYVFTAADFTRSSYADGFVAAWKFAAKYNTRLFAVTYTHGMPFNIDIPGMSGTWMTHTSGRCISSAVFTDIGLRLIGQKIPEFTFYAAPCFGMTTMSTAIRTSLFPHANHNILFGTYNAGTQNALVKFKYYAILGTKTVRDAYYAAETQNICFLGSTTYILPKIY